MKKKQINAIEAAIRREFLAEITEVEEPAQWQNSTMTAIMAEARREVPVSYWFSARQERILWRGAWAALALVLMFFTGYFIVNQQIDDSYYDTITLVDYEGWPE